MIELVIVNIRKALKRIKEPRFFKSERGYQGAFVKELTNLLEKANIWPDNPIVEQEYQKIFKIHGLSIRPDIIVHVPFERGVFNSRDEGNYVVIELKLNGSRKKALYDFNKLEKICKILQYSLGVFINIGSERLYLYDYLQRSSRNPNRTYHLHEFAVKLVNKDKLLIKEQGTFLKKE